MTRDVVTTPHDRGRIAAFERSGGVRKLERLVKDAQRIASGQMPFEEKAEAMIDVAERISKTITPFTPCTGGCSHCCYMAVAISDFEADMIGRHIGRDKTEVAGTNILEFEWRGTIEKYTGQPCPMLGPKGECTVYPVRPMACRTHHNMGKDETNCVIVDGDGPLPTTPMIDVNPFLDQHARVFCKRSFADIREWFPNVKGDES